MGRKNREHAVLVQVLDWLGLLGDFVASGQAQQAAWESLRFQVVGVEEHRSPTWDAFAKESARAAVFEAASAWAKPRAVGGARRGKAAPPTLDAVLALLSMLPDGAGGTLKTTRRALTARRLR